MRMLAIAGAAAALVIATGCVGSQQQSLTEALEAGIFFVEGYIEFGGPDSRWVGPEAIVMHVDARNSNHAKIEVTPTLFLKARKGGTPTSGRGLASNGKSVVVSSEVVRGLLGDLAGTLDSPDRQFRGCMTPIRVRLIRSDGAVVERQGCRTQVAWTRMASRVFSDLLSLAVDGRLPLRTLPSEGEQPKKDPGPPWIQTDVNVDLNAFVSIPLHRNVDDFVL